MTLFYCVRFKNGFMSKSSYDNHDATLDLLEKPVFFQNFQSQSDVVIQPTAPRGGKKTLIHRFSRSCF